MKVLFFVSNLSYPCTEGAHSQTISLIDYLIKSGLSVTISGFVKKDTNFDSVKLKNDIPGLEVDVVKFYKGSYLNLALKYVFFNDKFDFKSFDLVHAEGFGVISFLPRIKQLNIPVVFSMIDPWSLRHYRKYQFSGGFTHGVKYLLAAAFSFLMEKMFLHYADAVHLVSSSDAKQYQRIHKKLNISVIPLAFDEVEQKPTYHSLSKELSFVFWGDLSIDYIERGFKLFLDTINSSLVNNHHSVSISVLGRVSRDSFSKNFGCYEKNLINLTYVDWVDDISNFIKGHDVVLLCDANGTGLKNRTIQSMLLGMPVFATPFSVEGVAGLSGKDFVVYSDKDEIDKGLTLLSVEHKRADIGRSAAKTARLCYLKSVVCEKWILLYNKVISCKT